MTNIKKNKTEALTSVPQPIVRSYAGGKEIVTLNLNIQQHPSAQQADAPTMDGETNETYQCTTLSISHEGRLTANDVIRIIVQQDLFASIDSAFLMFLVDAYHIPDYDTLAAVLVSGRYTYAEELSAHRKALLGDKQPLEELNAYVEQCKRLAAVCFLQKNTIEA